MIMSMPFLKEDYINDVWFELKYEDFDLVYPNIYRLIEILKDFEQLAAIDFEKANQGQKKNRRTKEDLKDKQI